MTKYQRYIYKSNQCVTLAKVTKDNLMKQFYMRCAEGYKIKANSLKLKEVING